MPVVLDAQNAITRLLMLHFHEIRLHAGPEYVKSFLQESCLIFGVRAALRTISYRSFQCRRFRAENVQLMMAPLPRCRFSSTDTPYPFANSEVPCPALTTDSFINAFRRFIATRGQPHYIRSDNGKNELQETLDAGIHTALQTPPLAPEMECCLNPPFAPHFNGA